MDLASRSGDAAAPAATSARDPFRWLLAAVLRGGVAIAAALLVAGLALYFVHGATMPLAAGAREASGAGFAAAMAMSDPLVLITFGIFVLASLPIARVGLSLVHFAREGDRLYIALTTVVLVILVIAMVSGRVH